MKQQQKTQKVILKTDDTNSPVNHDMLTEEDFQIAGSASPFIKWTHSAKEEAMKKCESDSNGPSNQLYSEAFSEYLANS